MQRRRILFRADAGPKTGYGHFVRSCALAGYLRHYCEEHGESLDLLFASRGDSPGQTLTPFQQSSLLEVGASFIPLVSNDDFLRLLLPEDIVVLDNYYFTKAYQRAVKSRCAALVCLHDMPGHEFDCDVVISGTPLPRHSYSMPADALYFSGLQYFPLRAPFFAPAAPTALRNDEDSPIVLAMGGADPLQLARRLAPAVLEAFPESPLVIIGGKKEDYADERTTVLTGLTASEMVALFDRSKLGIFPASTVCIEALSRRLPILAGRFTDNQDYLYDYLHKEGYAGPLGDLSDLSAQAEDNKEVAAGLIRHAATQTFSKSGPKINFQKARSELASGILSLI